MCTLGEKMRDNFYKISNPIVNFHFSLFSSSDISARVGLIVERLLLLRVGSKRHESELRFFFSMRLPEIFLSQQFLSLKSCCSD